MLQDGYKSSHLRNLNQIGTGKNELMPPTARDIVSYQYSLFGLAQTVQGTVLFTARFVLPGNMYTGTATSPSRKQCVPLCCSTVP